jgi:hypothetical protein
MSNGARFWSGHHDCAAPAISSLAALEQLPIMAHRAAGACAEQNHQCSLSSGCGDDQRPADKLRAPKATVSFIGDFERSLVRLCHTQTPRLTAVAARLHLQAHEVGQKNQQHNPKGDQGVGPASDLSQREHRAIQAGWISYPPLRPRQPSTTRRGPRHASSYSSGRRMLGLPTCSPRGVARPFGSSHAS